MTGREKMIKNLRSKSEKELKALKSYVVSHKIYYATAHLLARFVTRYRSISQHPTFTKPSKYYRLVRRRWSKIKNNKR